MQKNYRFSLSKKILFWLQSEARFEGTIWFQQKAPPVLGVNLTPPPPLLPQVTSLLKFDGYGWQLKNPYLSSIF